MTWNMNAVRQAEALKHGKNKSNTLARLVTLEEKEEQARIERKIKELQDEREEVYEEEFEREEVYKKEAQE